MSAIVLLPGSEPRSRATVPSGTLRLSDGRTLRDRGEWMTGRTWQSPDGMRVLATLDDTPHGELLHVSISYAKRDPSWSDIRRVRDVFFPSDVDVMMVLPAEADYVNVHEHTFHLWQTPRTWGMQ